MAKHSNPWESIWNNNHEILSQRIQEWTTSGQSVVWCKCQGYIFSKRQICNPCIVGAWWVWVRVRRVFPGRFWWFKVLVHPLHTGGVMTPMYDGKTQQPLRINLEQQSWDSESKNPRMDHFWTVSSVMHATVRATYFPRDKHVTLA